MIRTRALAAAAESELISTLAMEGPEQPPEEIVIPTEPAFWRPSLNPIQGEVFDSRAKYVLAYGERGSGKSIGALHKMVYHCWNNSNALAILIVGVKRMATEGGTWDKLTRDIIPQWTDGIGLKATETKSNTAKDLFIYISNRHGGWSKILLLSMPVGSFVKDRVKGMEPSFILIDEAQTLESKEYFGPLIQQLNRRQGIEDPQQYVATCNPEGPSHWLYETFFVRPVNPESREWDPRYQVFHVPIAENEKNLPEGYYKDNVIEAVKDDPIEYRRMVLGEWIDRPLGSAIFATEYSEPLHVRGSTAMGTRLLPVEGVPITLGYDLGTANSAVTFMQLIDAADKSLWLVFDEMVFTDEYVPYPELVPGIYRRMDFWCKVTNHKFQFEHISDNSAFNQFRAATGTYDANEIERLSFDTAKLFPGLETIKMIECPKPPHSVAARVRLTKQLLTQQRLLISNSCKRIKDMFRNLECEKVNPNKYSPDLPFTPRRSPHLHSFDAMTYPMFYYELDTFASHRRNPGLKPTLTPVGVLRS